MSDTFSYELDNIFKEVQKICNYFLEPSGITYFQFKRIYKDNFFIILANHEKLFKDFLEKAFIDPIIYQVINVRQSNYYFWDELLLPEALSLTREKMGLYHGLTITMRGKTFFDCASFAMSKPHTSPTSYYLRRIKDFQDFSEAFPKRAQLLIKKRRHTYRQQLTPKNALMLKGVFLPKRSSRFSIGNGVNDYITTYEALCIQHLQDGKSHKEIGSLLSISTATVQTHLDRLKKRTNLTYHEASLHVLQAYKNSNP